MNPPDSGASRPVPQAPSDPPALVLHGLELSLGRVSLEELELAARHVTAQRLETTFGQERRLREVVVLRTCHRVELYLWTDHEASVDATSRALLPSGTAWARHEGDDAIRHLFRVAAGLESMAVGEREVRDQVRAAAAQVLSRSPRPVLRPLLLAAVEAANRAAPAVPAGRSMAAIASARVLEESPQPFPRVLIAGAGTVGRQVADLLASSCRVAFAYRSAPPDDEFLRSIGARAVPWASLHDELAVSDVLVSAAKSGERLIGPALLKGRTTPLLVIDLGVPRNVDPEIRRNPGTRLIDLAGLRPQGRAAPAVGVEAEIERDVTTCCAWVRDHGLEVWVDQFRRAAEDRRRALVEHSRPYLGPLTDPQRAAIEKLTQRLVAELLDRPSEGLRSLPPGPEGDAQRRWALRWVGLGPDRA